MRRLLAFGTVAGIYYAMGASGIFGVFIVLCLFHAAYRVKCGFWLGD